MESCMLRRASETMGCKRAQADGPLGLEWSGETAEAAHHGMHFRARASRHCVLSGIEN